MFNYILYFLSYSLHLIVVQFKFHEHSKLIQIKKTGNMLKGIQKCKCSFILSSQYHQICEMVKGDNFVTIVLTVCGYDKGRNLS